ncbi:MAG: HyaD/HybD family hydrogenase maturation endopeptidase [Proteobacteria bacterium]|nr:HyaD/HybD family hydrogenase maturation endopeptidase [Pseudomonadota bacterium]MBU1610577.1 HyaD/HybD family hydrogenase maturation endopeptidase [Pseudomonadota bacterium]
MAETKRILVLGVGNVIYTDEGIGVRLAETLEQTYEFSDNVEVLEGGTLGIRLMHPIMQCDYLIVADAVLGDGPPGSIYRLTGEDLRKSLSFRNSMHDTDLVDTLISCELCGSRPDAVIIGMEPEDYDTMSADLSPAADAAMPKMIREVLREVEEAGGSYQERTTPSKEVIYVPRSTS